MGAGSIRATDKADIDAAWLKVEAYLAERGIHKTTNSDPTDPVFWAQVDALQQHDPELSRLLMALTMSVTHSTPQGRDMLAGSARRELKAVPSP
jgi:hypothetical protein